MATILPEAEIDVSHEQCADTGKHHLNVSANRAGDSAGKGRSWAGEGGTVSEAVKDVFKKVFADPRSGEFIK